MLQGDVIAMTCMHTGDTMMSNERVCLSAEGFGSRICAVEGVSDRVGDVQLVIHRTPNQIYCGINFEKNNLQNYPPDMAICSFYIHQALSIRALQEMMKARESEKVRWGRANKRN